MPPIFRVSVGVRVRVNVGVRVWCSSENMACDNFIS